MSSSRRATAPVAPQPVDLGALLQAFVSSAEATLEGGPEEVAALADTLGTPDVDPEDAPSLKEFRKINALLKSREVHLAAQLDFSVEKLIYGLSVQGKHGHAFEKAQADALVTSVKSARAKFGKAVTEEAFFSVLSSSAECRASLGSSLTYNLRLREWFSSTFFLLWKEALKGEQKLADQSKKFELRLREFESQLKSRFRPGPYGDKPGGKGDATSSKHGGKGEVLSQHANPDKPPAEKIPKVCFDWLRGNCSKSPCPNGPHVKPSREVFDRMKSAKLGFLVKDVVYEQIGEKVGSKEA